MVMLHHILVELSCIQEVSHTHKHTQVCFPYIPRTPLWFHIVAYLLKLDHLGIRTNINKWLESFLTGKSQKVKVKSSDVIFGVPQGTVLGPLLFLAYINDLPECVSSSIRLFADELILYRQIDFISDCTSLQDDISALGNWESLWQMKFNIYGSFHETETQSVT